MNNYLIVLVLTALPAFSNFTGGLLAEKIDVSQRTLSLALHAAAGIVLAVVAVELLPQGFAAAPAWLIILAFVAGGVFFVIVDQGIGLLQRRLRRGEGSTGPWGVFFGVAVDLFSDGVMIGAGSTVALGLGLLLAIGQAPADLPEGFATIASFKREGVARRTRQLLAASFFLPIFLGATVGYWTVRGQPEEVKLALLAFTAGILMTVVIEEIVPEAHEGEEARVATLVLIGGLPSSRCSPITWGRALFCAVWLGELAKSQMIGHLSHQHVTPAREETPTVHGVTDGAWGGFFACLARGR